MICVYVCACTYFDRSVCLHSQSLGLKFNPPPPSNTHTHTHVQLTSCRLGLHEHVFLFLPSLVLSQQRLQLSLARVEARLVSQERGLLQAYLLSFAHLSRTNQATNEKKKKKERKKTRGKAKINTSPTRSQQETNVKRTAISITTNNKATTKQTLLQPHEPDSQQQTLGIR